MEWYPGVPMPGQGEIRYRMEIRCLCGRTTTLNHVNQCGAAMQHWAFTRVVYEDYKKAKKRVLKQKEVSGRVKLVKEDFPRSNLLSPSVLTSMTSTNSSLGWRAQRNMLVPRRRQRS